MKPVIECSANFNV